MDRADGRNGEELVERVGDHTLDNPVWHSLKGRHAWASKGDDLARRYDPEISVFSALADCEPHSWASLRRLVGPRGVAVLFRNDEPVPPTGWAVLARMPGYQLELDREARPTGPAPEVVRLDQTNVAAMADLVARTNPGPFTARTIELGNYLGVFDGGRLVAMAGERIRLPGYTEISAVCTDADYRGRGLAGHLTALIARDIAAAGSVPFLHVLAENPARHLYESLGFRRRIANSVLIVRADRDDN